MFHIYFQLLTVLLDYELCGMQQCVYYVDNIQYDIQFRKEKKKQLRNIQKNFLDKFAQHIL